jgi:hypothetical protein
MIGAQIPLHILLPKNTTTIAPWQFWCFPPLAPPCGSHALRIIPSDKHILRFASPYSPCRTDACFGGGEAGNGDDIKSGVVVCVGGLDSVAHDGLVVGIEADYCLGGSLEEEKVLMGFWLVGLCSRWIWCFVTAWRVAKKWFEVGGGDLILTLFCDKFYILILNSTKSCDHKTKPPKDVHRSSASIRPQ